MNNLFNPSDTAGILSRIEKLSPAAEKGWGKMNAGQMLAHCNASLETAMGLNNPKPLPLFVRLIGKLMKGRFLGEKPFPKNTGTDKSYIITDERDFEKERAKAIRQIKAFSEGGPAKCTTRPQVFFGQMTPLEWATMQWKHFDHHLRQFGV